MRITLTALLILAISGCATTAPNPARTQAERPQPLQLAALHPGERVVKHAVSMVGTPYRLGGAAPETGFDCSGLVYYSYGQSGVSVPRTSLEQFSAAAKISLNDAREGDILFFQDQEKLSHVGIFIGDGRFVHAPTSGRTVSIASLDNPWYQMHLVGVGRLLQ